MTSPTPTTAPHMAAIIDVADDENLVAEATAVGCTALKGSDFSMAGTMVYRVYGPSVTLLPLLAGWGYDEGDYQIDQEYCPLSLADDHKHSESWYDCEPCDLCGDNSVPESCDCGKPGHAADTPDDAMDYEQGQWGLKS